MGLDRGIGGNNTGSGSERHGSNTSSPASAYPHANTAPGRAVFGVPLEQALTVAQIANLPAIIFRCIEYLEAKKAAEEEGIYRLSGSSAVIKSLKDRFNHGELSYFLPKVVVSRAPVPSLFAVWTSLMGVQRVT